MAKLAARGALRRWLCLFLIGSAALCATASRNFNRVRKNNGTTTLLKKGECVVAIKVEFGNTKGRSTSPKPVKSPSTNERGPSLRMTCFAKSFDQDSLLGCQDAAEESCVGGQFVYEVPEDSKEELQEALKHWSTPNVSIFINCLKRDSDEISSVIEKAGRHRRGIKCHGGIEMQFERSLANSYPRIGVEILGDKTRQTKEPWYNGSRLARDIAQDGIVIMWSGSVSVECEDDPEEHLLFGIATSPGICPTQEVEEIQQSGNITPISMKKSCTLKEMPVEKSEEKTELPNAELPNAELPNAELPNAGPPNAELPNAGPPNAGPPNAGTPNGGPPNAGPPNAGPPNAGPPRANAELFFFEVEAGALRPLKGNLPLLPNEVISVKPLLHQEMYPFLGALPPRSGPFFEHSKRYHVKLQNRSKIRRKVKVLSTSKKEPKETPNVGLTTLECRCGTDKAILDKCFRTPNKETAPVYVSARSTDQLKWSIHQVLGDRDEGTKAHHLSIKKYYKFIIEGPWQPGSVFDPERPVTGRFKWIKRLYREIKRFFGRGPKWPPEILHLNPALFYSYRDLNASIIQYVHNGVKKFCYDKFEIRFNLEEWTFSAEWIDVYRETNWNIFPSQPNLTIMMVHDLVGPEFSTPKGEPLRPAVTKYLHKNFNFIILTKTSMKNQPERPKVAQAAWRCGSEPEEVATQSRVNIGFKKVINLRSTQIYNISPSVSNSKKDLTRI